MYLYRVCFPADVEPKWEDLPLPGGQNTLTGFWTPHVECAVAIFQARVDGCAHEFGGWTYARIFQIPANQVVQGPPARKTGHSDEFDRDEVFVVRLLGEPEDITDFICEKWNIR